MNGGGANARYFASVSYVEEGGMYNSDSALKDYKTNANYHRWNYRMNFDLNITKTTLLKVGVAGALENRTSRVLSTMRYGHRSWDTTPSPLLSNIRTEDGDHRVVETTITLGYS